MVIETPVAWGEMDSLQHVNNIVYFRYFESARMAYFDKLRFWDYMAETGIGPILASTQCKFRIPLAYPDTISAGARVVKVEKDRFLMEYVIFSHEHQRAAAMADDRMAVLRHDLEAEAIPGIARTLGALRRRQKLRRCRRGQPSGPYRIHEPE